jgi:trimeric autotransporter adhesin
MASLIRLNHLAAGAALLATVLAWAQPAGAQKVGVNSAVNPDASGTPPGASARRLVLGQEVVYNEHVVTGPAGQTQILFLDESAMSVGPNSDLTIDSFVYNPNTGSGQLAMSATKGVMRFVGGKLSKNEDAVAMRTPVGTIGVRGGVFLMREAPGGGLDVVFLYGKGLTVTGNCAAPCVPQTITRPGFAVSIAGRGAPPTPPFPAPPTLVAATLGAFNGRTGSAGGSSNPPSDASVASSGIGNTISGNVGASVQQALLNTPGGVQPQGVNVSSLQTNLSVNTAAPQGSPTVAEAQGSPASSGSIETPSSGLAVSGGVKVTPSNSTTGFSDQSSTGRFTFTGTLDNGTATGNDGNGTVFTLSPLRPGETTQVTGTASSAQNPASGTAFLAPDSRFFFANLTGQGSATQKIFVFGGAPVDASFFAAGGSPNLSAFSLRPDFALNNGSQAQTIPFLAPGGGGTLPNAVVSPLYVINQAGQPFGSFNANTNPSGTGTRTLQASLAINGLGSAQQSALNVSTGSFFTSSDTGKVVEDQIIRGMFLAGGNAGPIRTGSNGATVPDANGNTLFGGSAIDGFVLDSNAYNTNNNFVVSNANFNGNGSSTNYAFNQVALPTSVPGGVGTNRSALNEVGFFGGLMTNGSTRYALNGDASVISNPSANQVLVELSGSDLLTSGNSGTSSIGMTFGAASGRSFSRTAFVDNNVYAATESKTVPFTFNGNSLNLTDFGVNAPTGGVVTSATVPGAADGLFAAAGASPCACQFLQWGYWSANIPQTDANNNITRNDRSFINTWLAGQPTVTLPASGNGTYSGAAIGTVNNAGNAYLAAGRYSGAFSFSSNTGNVAINNFDGRNFSGNVSISRGSTASTFTGNLTGTNLSGQTFGGFFGPSGQETGGSFAVKNVSGSTYIASGIFAGKQ